MVRSAREGSVRTHVDAPPEKVYAVLADLERMGEWSPECYKVAWLDGARSPAQPGSRFKGWNRYGLLRWSMTCEVKAAEFGREIAFATVKKGRDLVTWRYRMEPSDGGGTELTESFECHWLPPSAVLAEDYLMVGRDRRRQQSMQDTVQRIKAAAES